MNHDIKSILGYVVFNDFYLEDDIKLQSPKRDISVPNRSNNNWIFYAKP